MTKSTKKKGSCHFLADKSYFENPLVTQWGVVIAMLKHIIPCFNFFFFLSFWHFPLILKMPHEMQRKRVSVNGESGRCGVFRNFHKCMGKRRNNLPLCGPRRFLFDCGVRLSELLGEKITLDNWQYKDFNQRHRRVAETRVRRRVL